jgi:hypothetical protein
MLFTNSNKKILFNEGKAASLHLAKLSVHYHHQICEFFLAASLIFSFTVQLLLVVILFLLCVPILIASLTFSGFLQ